MATLLSGSAIGQKLSLRREAYQDSTAQQTTSGTGWTQQSTGGTVANPVTSASHETINPNAASSDPGLISISTLISVIAELVFYVIIGGFASWLSWTSNSSIGWNPVFCVIFSILAFFFAGTYLMGHLIFKLDLLLTLRAVKSLLSPPTARANPIPNSVRPPQAASGSSSRQ